MPDFRSLNISLRVHFLCLRFASLREWPGFLVSATRDIISPFYLSRLFSSLLFKSWCHLLTRLSCANQLEKAQFSIERARELIPFRGRLFYLQKPRHFSQARFVYMILFIQSSRKTQTSFLYRSIVNERSLWGIAVVSVCFLYGF